MKAKVVLICIIAAFFSSVVVYGQGNPTVIPLSPKPGTGNGQGDGPRSSNDVPFAVLFDNSISAIIVSSLSDIGQYIAVVENMSTGTYGEFEFSSEELAIIPIAAQSGLLMLTLLHENGLAFYGELLLE